MTKELIDKMQRLSSLIDEVNAQMGEESESEEDADEIYDDWKELFGDYHVHSMADYSLDLQDIVRKYS